jgi:hypothetical protein
VARLLAFVPADHLLRNVNALNGRRLPVTRLWLPEVGHSVCGMHISGGSVMSCRVAGKLYIWPDEESIRYSGM